jgi:hypothetical protein
MMRHTQMFRRLFASIVLVAATSACGDVIRDGRSPVYLVVNSVEAAPGHAPATFFSNLNSDVIRRVTTPSPCTETAPCLVVFNDLGRAKVSLASKDYLVAPTSNNFVTINRYHINYRRADGRNTPGVDVPFAYDGATTVTVTGDEATVGFEIVRIAAKKESPLAQLVTNLNYITMIADVTFYGKDQVGNDVDAQGSISIVFGNFGDI